MSSMPLIVSRTALVPRSAASSDSSAISEELVAWADILRMLSATCAIKPAALVILVA